MQCKHGNSEWVAKGGEGKGDVGRLQREKEHTPEKKSETSAGD